MSADLAREWIFQEIREQPAIARRIAENPPFAWPTATRRVLVTGAGDCLAAAELARELCPGRRIEAWPALRASDHARTLGGDDALIALSVSGRTPRVVEAAMRARRSGANVIAVTDDPTSPLAENADAVWTIGASPTEALQESSYESTEATQYVGYHHDVAQTKTFLASLLTLVRSADHPGYATAWQRLPDLVESLCAPPTFVAEMWARASQAFVLGHGHALPLARFAAYKLFEFNRIAHFSDLEEYCHTHYFVTRPGDAVVCLLDDADGRRRAAEIAPVLRELFDARLVVIRSDDLPTLDFEGCHDLPVPAGATHLERIVALLLAVEWVTYLWGRVGAPDINTFHAGYDTERLVAASMRTIRRSKIG